MTTKTRVAALATSFVLAAVLTACGDPAPEPESPTTQGTTEDSAGAVHNDADTEFAQMMIIHHEGAVEMADLAVTTAENQDVKDLAADISSAQGPEIDTMTSWLEAWGEPTSPDDLMGGMDHGDMEMEGMDQESAMTELGALSGTEFDQRFLELMISHHEGAVGMAQAELEAGTNADALALAQTIIDAQTTEIALMEGMLDSL